MACPICVENMKSKKCVCAYCKFTTCLDCAKTYLLSCQTPSCMNPDCKHEWNNDFLYDTFTKTFIKKEYKNHREQVLFDKEIAYLQGTQPFVERVIRTEEVKKKIDALNIKKRQIIEQLRILNIEYYDLKQNKSTDTFAKVQYIGHCSKTDCNGYIARVGHSCGICMTKYCNKCMEVHEGDAHVCKQESVDTVKLLKSDTKPCPTCSIPIFKSAGCNQMFCTECKTVFDWTNGKIETDVNHMHNPHYYEYMTAIGVVNAARNAAPPCRRAGNVNIVHITNFATKQKLGKEGLRYLSQVCETMIHLRHNLHMIVIHDDIEPFERNLDIRIKYLMNKITPTVMRRTIQVREKALVKKKDIRNILGALIETLNTLLLNFINLNVATVASLDADFKPKIRAVVKMSHEGLEIVAHKYDCVVPDISIMYSL